MALALANRYASALAEVVTQTGSTVTGEAALGQLHDFQHALEVSEELRNILDSPAVTPADKRKLTACVAERLKMSAIMRNFLYVVIDHRRVTLLGEMIDALQNWIDSRNNVARIVITAARPIPEEQQEALIFKFGQVTGCTVSAEFAVAPELVGGVTVRFGSTIFDGSLRAQLNNLNHALLGDV
jgi:F-type H+-transporting ATPase subunit delta